MESAPHVVVVAQNLVRTVRPLAQDVVRRLIVLRKQRLEVAVELDLFECIGGQARPALILDGLSTVDLILVRDRMPWINEEVNFSSWPP